LPALSADPLHDHLTWLERALQVAARTEDVVARTTVFGQRASILLSVGDPAGWSAVDDIPECADGGPVAVKLELQRAYQDLGVAALGLGHPRRAEAFLARAFHNQIVLGCLLLSAGQLEESEACLASALDQGRGARSFLSIVTASAELARLHFVRGDARAALQLVDLPIELIRRKGVWVWATRLAPVATEALLACGEDRRARHFIDELALGLRGRDAPSARGALAFCRGAVDESQNRYRAAARSFGEAERCWNALPNPYQAGQAQEQRARCLLANDDRGGADVLIGAFETYERLGASWEAARVRAALRTHRVPLPYPWRGGRRAYGEELSPREAEVARLAGMGWTNREIAESLFLSPRTVQSHVASALRKRGVSSRRELSAIAAELAEAKNP
jgi:DNA-binding CsgD family transcriptional regulator